MATYSSIKKSLLSNPQTWLITGVAGFIGSNLLETLLELNQKVVGLDNFSTGNDLNLQEVQSLVSKKQWSKFKFIKGDISNTFVKTILKNKPQKKIKSELLLERPSVFIILLLIVLLYTENYIATFFKRFT